MRWMVAVLLVAGACSAGGQWTMQESHSTADLRGIMNVGDGVAWASGTHGTVLKTVDGGKNWQTCSVPPGAEKLDFRGVQAFDAKTAIVMSSGPGDASRLYKTVDGCATWKLIATNPEKTGFWDSIQADSPEMAYVLGDSVDKHLRLWEWKEGWDERELELSYDVQGDGESGEGSFAASNSVLELVKRPQLDRTWTYKLRWASETKEKTFFNVVRDESTASCEPCIQESKRVVTPIAAGTDGSGIFSFSFRTQLVGVAVGGDYSKPEANVRNAATTLDGGLTWALSDTLPHGYRSAVARDEVHKAWITVGPNGTDVSFDDGRNWRALKPSGDDAADADKNWNALSLPFVVGPKGRIGVLRESAVVALRGEKPLKR